MKRLLLGCAVAASGLAVAAVVLAEEKAESPTTAPATAPASTRPAGPVNTRCPVSGDAVDPKVRTVYYQGKTIGFCCDDCVAPFKKNPEKYMKNLK